MVPSISAPFVAALSFSPSLLESPLTPSRKPGERTALLSASMLVAPNLLASAPPAFVISISTDACPKAGIIADCAASSTDNPCSV